MWMLGNLASGGAAGGLSLAFVYPLEYARTRLSNDSKTGKNVKQFNGILDVWKKTLATDGAAGIYRGFNISVGKYNVVCMLCHCTKNNLKTSSWCHRVPWALLWTV